MGCDKNRMSIILAAAVFVAVSILKAFKTEDLSRKLEVNYVKFQFRGGLLVPADRYVVPTGKVIATVSIKVPTGRYIVPAGYIISPGLKDLSRAGTNRLRLSILKATHLVTGHSVTEECLERGIAVCKDGALFRKIRKRISEHAEKFGYAIMDRFVGHGVGTVFHSEPLIFHHRNEKPGSMVAKPILTLGTTECVTWEDNWTTLTKDGSPAAQFEQTILITKTGAEILTKCEGESKTNVNKTISGVSADDFDDALSFTESRKGTKNIRMIKMLHKLPLNQLQPELELL
ncbi:methionine aminopeptidase 1B, chloroplastic [Tanacetum coccineum]